MAISDKILNEILSPLKEYGFTNKDGLWYRYENDFLFSVSFRRMSYGPELHYNITSLCSSRLHTSCIDSGAYSMYADAVIQYYYSAAGLAYPVIFNRVSDEEYTRKITYSFIFDFFIPCISRIHDLKSYFIETEFVWSYLADFCTNHYDGEFDAEVFRKIVSGLDTIRSGFTIEDALKYNHSNIDNACVLCCMGEYEYAKKYAQGVRRFMDERQIPILPDTEAILQVIESDDIAGINNLIAERITQNRHDLSNILCPHLHERDSFTAIGLLNRFTSTIIPDDEDVNTFREMLFEINERCSCNLMRISEFLMYDADGISDILHKYRDKFMHEVMKANLLMHIVYCDGKKSTQTIFDMFCEFHNSKEFCVMPPEQLYHCYILFDSAFFALKPEKIKYELLKFIKNEFIAVYMPRTVEILSTLDIPEYYDVLAGFLHLVPCSDGLDSERISLLQIYAIAALKKYPKNETLELLKPLLQSSDKEIRVCAKKVRKYIEKKIGKMQTN